MPYSVIYVVLFFLSFLSSSMLIGAEPAKPAAVLPADRHFERGFSLNGTKHGDPVRLLNAQGQDDAKVKPAWTIAQWHSRGKLDKVEDKGDILRLYDEYKSLTINRKTGAFGMTILGGKEYAEGPRDAKSTPWVHLLLSQGDTMKTPMLHTLDRLVVELEFELTEFRSILEKPSQFHAAQFLFFMYLRGVDRENPAKYKNFTWFGISLFDNRKDFTDDYAARDFAMQNGQLIYTIGSKHTRQEKVDVGKRIKIEVDVLPYVKKAIVAAHERGFMEGTEYEDTLFNGMNMGWEVPGVFDCGVTVHKFVITPYPAK